MTGQPDIAAALAWSGEAARAAANAQAALRGEPVPALLISSEAHLAEAEASPANPYGSTPLASLRERKHYDDPHVITRDELLADWRAANPGACSCPGTKGDPSCPQHGTAAANLGLTGETAEPGDVTRAGAVEPQCEAAEGAEGNWYLCLLPGGHTGPHKNDVATWDEPGDVTP